MTRTGRRARRERLVDSSQVCVPEGTPEGKHNTVMVCKATMRRKHQEHHTSASLTRESAWLANTAAELYMWT